MLEVVARNESLLPPCKLFPHTVCDLLLRVLRIIIIIVVYLLYIKKLRLDENARQVRASASVLEVVARIYAPWASRAILSSELKTN